MIASSSVRICRWARSGGTGLLLIGLAAGESVLAQTPPPPPPATADTSAPIPATTPVTNQNDKVTEPTIVLSPFEVDATKAKGYFAPNTLAGTRLNSNIADLASPITVVTKQEMVDTGSLNINDVFMYQANAEGSRSYTVAQIDRNSVHDVIAGYDNSQNPTNNAVQASNVNSTRLSGLGVPDIDVNNFLSSPRYPFDSYNVDSVEIERGPNSIIFGAGSPAGIVNSTEGQAKINKLSGDFMGQVSSWGGVRETFDLNVPLLKDKAALYIAQVYNSVGFERKPASDMTRRQYAELTIDPFSNHHTRIVASVENYNNYANDANSLTPTDFVTPWINSGKPVYNPLNSTVTYLATGKTAGPYALSTTDSNYIGGGQIQSTLNNSASPFFVPSLTFPSGRPILFYNGPNFLYGYQNEPNGLVASTGTAFFAPGTQNGGTALYTPAQELVHAERLTNSTNLPIPANISSGSWQYPGVTNKAIYNWLNGPNIDAPNSSTDRFHQYYVDITQVILPNLNADLAYFRQELAETTQQFVGQVTPVSIFVDTNQYLLNGLPNPYVGEPVEADSQADVFRRPETNTNWRGSLEYTLNVHDFSFVPSWLDWLGKHRFMTVYSKHDDWNEVDRYRSEFVGGEPGYQPTQAFVPTVPFNNWSYASNGSGYQRWYYLGTPGSNAVTQPGALLRAPNFGGQVQASIQTYNYTLNQWQGAPVGLGSELFFAGTPGDTENVQDQKTYFWQGYLWNDRIIGTVGANHDQVSSRATAFPANQYQEYIGGFAQPSVNQLYTPWQYVGGNTESEGIVVRPLSHWEGIDRMANEGNILWGIARAVGFTFNKANNFNPPSGFQTDYFGNPIPKPQGTEKDYGIELATPDNKLYARMTWFTASNENAPFSPVEQARVEYLDTTQLRDWAVDVTQIRDGISNPATDQNFGSTTVYPVTATQQAQIQQLTGLPYTYTFGQSPTNGSVATGQNTETATSKGWDLEVIYNPVPNWTLKLTAGHQVAGFSQIEPQALAYVAYRMAGDPGNKLNSSNGLPGWQQYSAADLTSVIIKKDGTPLYLGSFWQGYGYDGNVPYNGTNGGPTTTALYYQNVVGSVISATTSSVGAAVPNEHRYSGSFLTNYMIDRGPLKNFSLGTGITWQDAAIVGYYGATDPSKLNAAGQLTQPDLKRPIYTPAETHIDAWIAYGFAMPWTGSKLRMRLQFNVRDLTSNGYLLPITYNYDGTPGAERIISPRQYVFSDTVSF